MKKYFLFIAAILILGSSCKKDFLAVNEANPNSPSSVPGNFILPAALNATASIMTNQKNWDFINLWYGIWSISGGYTINADLAQYNIRNSSYQGNFDNLYIAAKSFNDIQLASTTPQQQVNLGIAKIMKSFIFQNLVDLYGDVPYTEAFLGSANLKPKYDKQADIYKDLLVQINAGLTAINTAPADAYYPTRSEDIMFGNSTVDPIVTIATQKANWIKFANTLKLRILIHQSGMAGKDAELKAAAQAITGGFLTSGISASTNPGYLHTSGKTNPMWAAFYNADGTDSHVDGGFNYYSANQDAINKMMNNLNGWDWRVFAFYSPYGTASLAGNYFAVGSQLGSALCSGIGTGNIKKFDQNAVLLSDFESLFLQAEAAQRGWIGTPADAKTYYYAALKANYTYLGLTSNAMLQKYGTAWGVPAATLLTTISDYDQFIASNNTDPTVDFDTAPDKIKLIISQKWAALSGNTPVEIWTDYRRSGFPTGLTFSADAAKKNATPPVRLLYTQNEISRNGENVPLIGRNTADLFSAKIFWQNR